MNCRKNWFCAGFRGADRLLKFNDEFLQALLAPAFSQFGQFSLHRRQQAQVDARGEVFSATAQYRNARMTRAQPIEGQSKANRSSFHIVAFIALAFSGRLSSICATPSLCVMTKDSKFTVFPLL